MSTIAQIKAREILDSRGNPTIETEILVENNLFTAAVPSGASTGNHEALELRDGGKRFLGKGVKKAINNVEKKIAPLLRGIHCTRQQEIDSLMIEADATKNKRKLGANAILSVSLASARAGAEYSNLYLFEYLNKLLPMKKKMTIPRLFFNVINGGKHADNELSFQEFMISPRSTKISEGLRMGSEVYHILKRDIHKKYGKGATNVGDEGGFAPEQMRDSSEALNMLVQAIKDAGYQGKVDIAIDCAASEFFKKNSYFVDGKKMSTKELFHHYLYLIKKYPIISLEDPFEQEDFESFTELTNNQLIRKRGIQVVGDDLTVTNVERMKKAIEQKSCNCLLLKVNQIGTLTEALQAVRLAYEQGWKVMVSHRSGETEDPFIADLAVGIGCGQIKAGAPCRGERTAKYNRLMLLAELMG